MPNRRIHDHLVACKFKVEIDGVTVAAFTSCDGIESKTDVVIYQDGDSMEQRKRPGRTTYSNIILRRGYVNTDELWNWYKQVTDGNVQRKFGSIVICGDDMSDICRYNFFEAWPCRWKSMEVDGGSTEGLIEEFEIVVEKIQRG